jgi:BirA family biotin operon repressor/biotin-[acetyl-CoA-carboxylase] ligase
MGQKDAAFVMVSAAQTAGRGRLGRTWLSPPGGVYISVLLEAEFFAGAHSAEGSSVSLAALSPLAALAAREALQEFAGEELLIKWPNDVVSPRGKFAGILVEMKQGSAVFADMLRVSDELRAARYVIFGVGANVNRPDNVTMSGAVADGAAYLNDGTGRLLGLEDIAAALINGIFEYYRVWLAGGCLFAPFVEQYRAHMALVGKQVLVRDALGVELANGVTEGIDDTARLLLAGERGTVAVSAGEVTLRDFGAGETRLCNSRLHNL